MLTTLGIQILSILPFLTATSPSCATPVTGQAESHFGPPLVVNGVRVSDDEFERYFVFGIGYNQLEKMKFDTLLSDEINRRLEAGADPADFEVTEEEIDNAIRKTRKTFERSYPTLDWDTETRRAFLSAALYRLQIEQQQRFDKLFLPNDPRNWPDISREAMVVGGGPAFYEDAINDYEERKVIQEKKGMDHMPATSPMWKDVWRSMVLELINSYIDVETNPEVLPEGVALIAEGVPIMLDDVYEKISHVINDEFLEEARHWLALTKALEQRLESEHALVTWTEFFEEWVPEGGTFHKKLYDYQMLALQGLGYPSVYQFIERERLEMSFRRFLEGGFLDEARVLETEREQALAAGDDEKAEELRVALSRLANKRESAWIEIIEASLDRTNKITGAAEVDCEMILLSAYDYPRAMWKEDGWEDAKQRAAKVRVRLDKGSDWDTLLDRYSEFWDPPMPEDGSTPEHYLVSKGRFGSQTRNTLLGCVEESAYTIFMDGNSIADHAFFDMNLNSIEGPFKGRRGYYLIKVKGFRSMNRPLSLKQPVHLSTAELYFLRSAFNEFAREVESESEFEGWEPTAPIF